MFGLSPVQILIVLLIALVVFGAKRLPEMARGLGSGMREFKDGITGQPPPVPAADPVAASPVADRSEAA
jgi:sec-independent protein translocase protein TatA